MKTLIADVRRQLKIQGATTDLDSLSEAIVAHMMAIDAHAITNRRHPEAEHELQRILKIYKLRAVNVSGRIRIQPRRS